MKYYLLDKARKQRTEISRADALFALTNIFRGGQKMLEKLEDNVDANYPQTISLTYTILIVEK